MVVNFKVLTGHRNIWRLRQSALGQQTPPRAGPQRQGDHERIACSQPFGVYHCVRHDLFGIGS